MTQKPKPIPPVEADGIPDELKAVNRWFPWHGVWKESKGKYDKQPYHADGYKCDAHNPANWMPFDDAYDLHTADPDVFSGVGFDMGYDEGTNLTYWLFDADHIINGGKIDPTAQAILNSFKYGHRELSVGLDGFHIVFATVGETPKYGANPDGNPYELYSHKHFSTMTGIEYQNGDQPLVAPLDAVKELISLAGLKPLEKPTSDSDSHDRKRKRNQTKRKSGKTGDDASEPLEEDGQREVREVTSMLAIIDPAELSYNSWLKVGMALHAGNFDCSYWDEWSREDKRYKSGECAKKWETFDDEKGEAVSIAYLKDMAYKLGWMPDNPPEVPGFYCSGGWLYERPHSKSGYDKRLTSTPPYILADIVDIDTGATRALVGVTVSEGYKNPVQREVVLDREVLFNHTKIVDALSPLRAVVSSANARGIVEYLTQCDGAKWAANRPCYQSVSRMGWTGKSLEAFMPYDNGREGVGIRFDAPLDSATLAIPFLNPKGTLAEWADRIAPLRAESVILRAMLATSFASVLLEPLEVQPFVLYVLGDSGSGKSTSVKIAGSVWGNPNEGAGYYATLSDTDTAIELRASFLHSFPMLLDEFESKRGKNREAKRANAANLIYDLTYGVGKNTGRRDRSLRAGGSWKLTTIAAGETAITGDTTQQGALRRVIEITGEPFRDERSAEKAHRAAKRYYGTAGRAFIEYVKARDIDAMCEGFEAFRERVFNALPGNPQAANLAVVAFADALAERSIFNPTADAESWETAMDGSIAFARALSYHTKSTLDRDTDRKAIAFAAEWLTMNEVHFYLYHEQYERPIIEPYGKVEKDEDGALVWYVMASVFGTALESAGYDREKTMRRMEQEGILKRPAGKNTRGRQMRKSIRNSATTKPYCYAIISEALDAFLSVDASEDVAE